MTDPICIQEDKNCHRSKRKTKKGLGCNSVIEWYSISHENFWVLDLNFSKTKRHKKKEIQQFSAEQKKENYYKNQ